LLSRACDPPAWTKQNDKGDHKVKFKTRVLPLAVAAGLATSVVGATVPAAHAAAAPLTPTCGVALQGNVDPTGGNLPGGITPITPPNFAISGNVVKGQDKIVADLNNSGAGIKRFAIKEVIADTVDPVTVGADAIAGHKVVSAQWKNGKASEPAYPTFKIDIPATKGVLTGIGGADSLGAQIGEITSSPPVYNIVIPKAGSAGGTFTFGMTIPRNAQGGDVPPAAVSIPFPAINVVPNAAVGATIQGTVQAVMNGTFGPGAFTVGTTTNAALSATTDGNYTVTFSGPGVTAGGPPILAIKDTQTGVLADSILDDGSAWNGLRAGGGNPAITPVADLGHGVYTAQGVFSSSGKAQNAPNKQLLVGSFPQALIDGATGANPNYSASLAVAAALPILSAIAGISIPQQPCALGGLLVLFCAAQPDLIPATFSGLCGALTTP